MTTPSGKGSYQQDTQSDDPQARSGRMSSVMLRTVQGFGQWIMDLTHRDHVATWWRNRRWFIGAHVRDWANARRTDV